MLLHCCNENAQIIVEDWHPWLKYIPVQHRERDSCTARVTPCLHSTGAHYSASTPATCASSRLVEVLLYRGTNHQKGGQSSSSMYNPLTKHAQQGFIYMKVTFSFAVKKSIKNVKNIQYFLNPVIPNGLVVSLPR